MAAILYRPQSVNIRPHVYSSVQAISPSISLDFRLSLHIIVTMTEVHDDVIAWKRYPPYGPLARYLKFRVAHAPGIPGTFSHPPRYNDPDMHHGTCVTHVPWCMPRSLTSGLIWSRRRGKTFPAFPAHAQPAILPIWQEAHWPFVRRIHLEIHLTEG